MSKIRRSIAIAMLGASSFATMQAHSADGHRGRLLYENHCTVCHASVVHVRERKIAKTPADVAYQVARWQRELGLEWNPQDIEDVSDYLSTRFYQFKGQP